MKKVRILESQLNKLFEVLSNRVIIIYHRIDWDGYTSAAIALRAYPNADLLGWNYGDALPDVASYDTVILVDLTISDKNDVSWMLENRDKLIWIDHHANSISLVGNSNIRGIRGENVGGCILTWKYFFKSELPLHVALCGTYDVFRKDGKYATWNDAWAYQLSLNKLGRPSNEENSDAFVQKALSYINEPINETEKRIENGYQLEKEREKNEVEFFKSAKFVINNENIKICKLVGDGQPAMLIKNNIDNHTADLFAIISTKPLKFDNSKYKVALRVPENSTVDASEIARRYGGNGHIKAAGCIMTLDEFNSL